MRKWVFNRDQMDAYAKILDNIATAVLVALMIGIFIDSKVSMTGGVAMGVCGIVCIVGATFLRGR